MSTNRRVRESPVEAGEEAVAEGWASRFKTGAEEGLRSTNEDKNAGRSPGGDAARHTDKRDSRYRSRSHKYTDRHTGRFCKLPDSSDRMDSREEIYTALESWEGQSHE